VLAESVIYSDIDPFFEFPPQAYAVVGEGVPPFELFERGKYVTRTAPYDTADTSPDILPEFDLEGNHIVVVVLSFVVAAHTLRTTQAGFHQPGCARGIEFAVQLGGYDTAFLFLGERFDDANVPPWAMKVVLDEEEFTGAAASPASALADALAEEDDLYRELNNS
jgi:hypothetical protein